MKKKLLTATLAVAMGATLVGAVAGCNTDTNPSDEQIAESAIDIIRTIYYDDPEETDVSYQVTGKVQAEGTIYDVNWTVIPDASCQVENFSNYVSVGTELNAYDEYTVRISNAEVKLEYTLKASVTVGEVTKSVEFKHSVPAGTVIIGDKTEASLVVGTETRTAPTSAQQVYTNGNLIVTNDQYNSSTPPNEAYPTRFYKGSKVTIEYPGMIQLKILTDKAYTNGDKVDDYPNWLKTCIEAAAWDGVTVSLNEETLVVTVNFATPVESFSFEATAGQVRVNKVDVVGRPGGATAQQKVDVAKTLLALDTTEYSAKGTYDLPAALNGTTVTWSVKETSEYVSVNNDGKLVIGKMPSAETPIVLVANIAVGTEASATKEITIKLAPIAGVEHAGTLEDPYLPSEALIVAKKLEADQYSGTVYVKGYIVEPGVTYTSSSQFKNFGDVYIANSADSTKTSEDALYIFRPVESSVVASAVGFQKGELVTFEGKLQNYKGTTMELTGGKCVKKDVVEDNRTDAEKAAAALAAFAKKYDGQTITGNVSLTSSVTGVTLTITNSTNTDVIATTGTVTRPAANTDVTLTVKATCGSEQPTQTVTVTVAKVVTFEAGTYKVYIDLSNATDTTVKGKTLYFNGTINTDEYGVTTETATEAAVVTVEAVTGGYTLKVGEQYLELYTNNDGKVRPTLTNTASSTTKWAYDGDLGVFTWTIGTKVYYLGCYTNTKTNTTYTTISASETTYITGTNAENVGKTQFPISFEKTEVGPDTRDDDAKIAAALEAVTLNATYKAGTYNLPTTNNGATLSWVVTSGGDVASIPEGSNVLTITNPASSDSAVTLTVTISCGNGTPQTKPVNFTVTYVAPVNYGDSAHPLSVTEAVDNLASKLGADAWTEQVVWMKGIAESTAEISANGSYYQTFSIKDENSTKTISVYSINLRDGVAAPVQNDLVTISGYITNYSGNKIQFSRNTKVSPTVEVWLEKNVRGTSAITVNAAEGMTVSGLGETAQNGSQATFTVTGEVPSGKTLLVKVNNKEISATDGSYTFTVNGDTTVAVILDAGKTSTATIDYSAKGYTNQQNLEGQVIAIDDKISIKLDKGTNTNDSKYYTTGTAARVYGGGHITVTAIDGYVITDIALTFGSSDGSNAITADEGKGTYNSTTNTWTGSLQEVVLNVGGSSGHRRIKTVTVSYEKVEG